MCYTVSDSVESCVKDSRALNFIKSFFFTHETLPSSRPFEYTLSTPDLKLPLHSKTLSPSRFPRVRLLPPKGLDPRHFMCICTSYSLFYFLFPGRSDPSCKTSEEKTRKEEGIEDPKLITRSIFLMDVLFFVQTNLSSLSSNPFEING